MKSVMVIGNARSGTSLTSGLLSILGVNMNETPLKQKSEKVIAQNPKGAFENEDFIFLTVDMQKDFKRNEPLDFIQKKYNQRIKDTIRKYEAKPMWGFKSALTTKFAHMFVNHMQNPHVVFVFRNLLHNAQSWQVQMKHVYGENITIQHALNVMSEQQNALVTQYESLKCPKHLTTYESIKSDAVEEARKLSEFLKVPFTKEDEVKEFVMPKYSTLNAS